MLLEVIAEIHRSSRHTYGARRIHASRCTGAAYRWRAAPVELVMRLSTKSRVGGHEILPSGGHVAARWRSTVLPSGGQQSCPQRGLRRRPMCKRGRRRARGPQRINSLMVSSLTGV